MSKEKTEELKKYRNPPRLNKVLRKKDPIPYWRKKYEKSTIEIGVVIDQQLYKNMAVRF